MQGKHIGQVGWLAALLLATVLAYAGDEITLQPSRDITQDVNNWIETNDTGATITSLSNVSDSAYPGQVLQLKYDLGTGQWVNIEGPAFSSVINLSSLGNALKLDHRGEGRGNLFKVELQDVNGQNFQCVPMTTTTTASDWQTEVLPFSSFTWGYGGNTGNAFAWDQIRQIGLTVSVSGPGSGVAVVDNLIATTIPTTSVPAELLVDECENGTWNSLSSTVGTLSGGTISTTSAVTPVSGSLCFQVSNPGGSGEEGIWEYIGRNQTSPSNGAPISVTPYTHLSFYVQAQAEFAGNLRVSLKDNTLVENGVTVQNYLTDKTVHAGAWQRVLIPLADVSGNSISLSNLGQLTFFLPPGATIYLDHISFNSITFSSKPDTVIDSMDTYYTQSSWKTVNAGGTQLTLSTVPGKTGNALRMDYTLTGDANSGQWVKAYRGFATNLHQNDADAFFFDYSGSDANNNVEFKVTDVNTTVFIYKIPKITNTGGAWKTITLPYTGLSYFSGTNTQFDFTQLTKVALAVTKDNGGSGTFNLHNIRFGRKADFQQTYPAGRIIQSLTIDNNPFAPQTDSARNTANFTYVLNEPAEVWLNIYDLVGNLLVKLEAGQQVPTSQGSVLTWDGSDRNHSRVRNGLYLYMFVAKGQKATQKIKNVIAVVR